MARAETVTCDICGAKKEPDQQWASAVAYYREQGYYLEFHTWRSGSIRDAEEAGSKYADLCGLACMHKTLDRFVFQFRRESAKALTPPSPPPDDPECPAAPTPEL